METKKSIKISLKVLIAFIIILVIVIISFALIILYNNVIIGKYFMSKNSNQSQASLNSILNASYIVDKTNNESIANNSEFIIIGTVSSIEGIINDASTDYMSRYITGKIKVERVLKGDLTEKNIEFMRFFETLIHISEFEKFLSQEDKFEAEIENLIENEEHNYYVVDLNDNKDDIQIENNKTYLMYLTHYNSNKYMILFEEYGLREIDIETLNKDYKDIRVKNNKTNKYETLDTILPNDLNNNVGSSNIYLTV